MSDRNRAYLIQAAKLLGPLLDELVFVGGVVTGLLITDRAAGESRVTIDIDAIARILSYAEYTAFGERLRGLGFSEDTTEGAPVCRWIQPPVILDVIPLDEGILGFSSRWYGPAMNAAASFRIAEDLDVRIVTAPYFLATKLEALRGRGQGDLFASKDLEDVVGIIDGLPTIVAEVGGAPSDLIVFLCEEIGSLIANPRFEDAIAGCLLPDAVSQARIRVVLERLHQILAL